MTYKDLSSHCSGGWQSDIMVLAGAVSGESTHLGLRLLFTVFSCKGKDKGVLLVFICLFFVIGPNSFPEGFTIMF